MKKEPVPAAIKEWNWGAFMFSSAWGFGHRTYLPLLCLIPYFGFIWRFVVGFKGNEWAWKKGDYESVAAFKAAQQSWNKGGLANFCVVLGMLFLALSFLVIVSLTLLSLTHRF